MSINKNITKITAKLNGAKLVVVTKNQPLESVQEAIACGVTAIGENRVQEAEDKLPFLECEKHFIGQLQSNKVRKAVELFDVIQSVDSEKIARKIDSVAPMKVFIQVNTSGKTQQSGIKPEETIDFYKTISQLPNLEVIGLMTIASIENPRPCFQKLFQLNQELGLQWLSMGMTDDYELAIEEGSNLVRIGRAIFR